MSFRELRNLCETLRSLGYARKLSIESFRLPNFELVADILYWLVQRHDPSVEIVDDIETESDRIRFLTSIAELLQVKFHIRLNCARLYAANGNAAQELLKLARVLSNAMMMKSDAEEEIIQEEEVRSFDTKNARTVATELTQDGTRLFDLLLSELENADTRDGVVAKPPELTQVETALKTLQQEIQEQSQQVAELHSQSVHDDEVIQQKIEAKRTKLDRQNKRLKALETTRPAHQEEYESMETDLAHEYVTYLEDFRNLEFLESELRTYQEDEAKLIEEQEQKLQYLREKLRRDELQAMRDADNMESQAVAQAQMAHRAMDARMKQQQLYQQQQQQAQQAAYQAYQMQHNQNAGAAGPAQSELDAQRQAHNNRPSRPPSGRNRRQPGAADPQAAKAQMKASTTTGNMYGDSDSDSDDSALDSSDSGDLMVSHDQAKPLQHRGAIAESDSDTSDSDDDDTDDSDDSDDDSDDSDDSDDY